MAKVSTQLVIDGITLAIRGAFPVAFVDIGETEQGIIEGSFVVQHVVSFERRLISMRKHKHLKFDIIYFPRKQGAFIDCMAVAEALSEALEVITIPGGDKLRVSDVSFEVKDGVLHYFVTYKHNVYTEQDEIHMNKIKVQERGVNG